jgi:hypothetical protein
MSTRKSPIQSATLYEVGTKKKGNDGNTWIIVENKNNVKRWQLYKKVIEKEEKIVDVPKTKKISPKTVSITDSYNIPKIKKNNWTKWLENLNSKQKKYIDKVRNSYKSIEKETGIIVIEVILPLSENGLYYVDYPWDYAKQLYPDINDDDNAYMMIIFKIDENLHLDISESNDNKIVVQHKGILRTYKKNLLEYIENFNEEKNGKMSWNGRQNKAIEYYL